MKRTSFVIALLLTVATGAASADEKIQHFPALQAPDVGTAFCNLRAYNEKLKEVTKSDKMSAEELVKVHELTYTLENALARLNETVEEAAEDLEKVHKASEVLDQKTVKASGQTYLALVEAILTSPACPK